MLIQPTERAEHDRRVNNMSIRKVVAGLLITAGIAIMAVPQTVDKVPALPGFSIVYTVFLV